MQYLVPAVLGAPVGNRLHIRAGSAGAGVAAARAIAAARAGERDGLVDVVDSAGRGEG